ncbi:MAG: hypothetical protein SGI87_02220 [Flavobacteriales bacterium]|nr:hypothetical protein [Flavobacteriales bacterium]
MRKISPIPFLFSSPFLFLSLFTTFAVSSSATDLLVADGGAGGTYATITDAISASVSGDRIIITPKPAGAVYSENLTITNKSLQFLTATEGTYWKLTGNITFNPAAAGMNLTVSGAHITSGYIATSISSPAGTRTKVTIIGCKLTSGYIDFALNNYDLNVAADSLMNGYVYLRYGKVLGNYINVGTLVAHGISVGNDPIGTNEVFQIVGNKILATTYSASATYGIYYGSSNQFFNISNNYIDGGGQNQNSMYIASTKSSSANSNYILNNTIEHSSTNSWAVYIGSHTSYNYIMNNAIENNGTGVYGIGSNILTNSDVLAYNYIETSNTPFGAINNDGTNFSGVSITVNNNTGAILTGLSIDGGSADLQYSDLDLSRNDAGCFGGSLSRANYVGTTNTTTQVTFFSAPRRILNGQTIDISAEGFDR